MRKQCELHGVARSTVSYQAVPEDPEDIRIKRLLDEIYMVDPCLGSRNLVTVLKRDHGVDINRKQRAKTSLGDRSRSDLVQAAHQHSGSRPPQISLPVTGSEDH